MNEKKNNRTFIFDYLCSIAEPNQTPIVRLSSIGFQNARVSSCGKQDLFLAKPKTIKSIKYTIAWPYILLKIDSKWMIDITVEQEQPVVWLSVSFPLTSLGEVSVMM